jgi:hypothetical protein
VPLPKNESTEKAPKTPVKKPPSTSGFKPPQHEINAFARCIPPAIQAYFNTEAGQREFEERQKKWYSEGKTA